MKFSRATTLIALCAVSCLAVLPSVVNAQGLTIGKPTTTPGDKTTTEPTSSAQSTSKQTTQTTSSTTTTTTTAAATVTTRTVATTTAPAKATATSSVSIPPPIAPPVPTGTGGVIGAACINSDGCGALLCALTPESPNAGTCQAMPLNICRANPPLTCTKNADCNAAYSYCMSDPGNSGIMTCVGLGTPNATDYCPNNTSTNDSGSLAPTIKYAGIAVGCVAALGLLFAGVRWQRRRQRSKVPENMFGEIDYGMTDRSAPKSAEQTYPFSSRPHAHGSDHAPSPPHDNGYDNQYYDDGYQKDQYYGNDQYNNSNQYYGNQQDNYGYDHHSGHGGQGGQGGQGGGFYDNVDYNDYPQNGAHHSPIATPAAAVRSPRQNNYGAEPSELDYGGHGGNGGYGHGGHGGQGGQGGYY